MTSTHCTDILFKQQYSAVLIFGVKNQQKKKDTYFFTRHSKLGGGGWGSDNPVFAGGRKPENDEKTSANMGRTFETPYRLSSGGNQQLIQEFLSYYYQKV